MKRIQWSEQENKLVCAEYHAMVLAGTLPSRAEDAWHRAQLLALEDVRRHRPFTASSTASMMKKLYINLRDSGAFEDKKRASVITAPPPEEKDPNAALVHVNALVNVRQDVYSAVVAHHAKNNPPKRPTLDEVFAGLVDERIAAAIPTIMEKVTEQMRNLSEDTHRQLDTFFGKIMRQIDPNWVEPPKFEGNTQPYLPIPSTAPRKKLIVLINPKPNQISSIQRDFPDFEVQAVDGAIPSEHRAAAVVGFGAFMSEPMRKQCKGRFGNNYIHIPPNQSVSTAKTLLQTHFAKAA